MLNFYWIWLTVFTVGIIKLLIYLRNLFKYWKDKNVPYIPLRLPDLSLYVGDLHKNYYDWAKKNGHKHLGIYTAWIPTYMPIEPALIKDILATNFNKFPDRGIYYNEEVEAISQHLFALDFVRWKQLRAKLTPTFTSGKLKMMTANIIEMGENLRNAVWEISSIGEPVNVKALVQMYTTDTIGSVGFGLECNSFKDPNSEFTKIGLQFVDEAKMYMIKCFMCACFPSLAKRFRIRTMSKEISDFYLNVTKETVRYRKENNITRNDFLQLCIDLKNDPKDPDSGSALTVEEIAAQCFLFFIAGFETSSSTISFCMYELALNLEIQDKVRSEINSVLRQHNNELTYNALMDMKYTGQVIDETLRKYPILAMLSRKCVEEHKIPETDTVIDKGTLVIIPAYAVHRDPDNYPNPEKFDPERFNDANKSKIIPFTFLSFGDGPKNCIGLRLGLMQVKIALVSMLRDYLFTLNKATVLPVKMDPELFLSSFKDTIWFDVKKLKMHN